MLSTALQSEFPLTVYFTGALTPAMSCPEAELCSALLLGPPQQDASQEEDTKPQPNGKKERGVVLFYRCRLSVGSSILRKNFYRKGGQALAGLARKGMEPPALEASKEYCMWHTFSGLGDKVGTR